MCREIHLVSFETSVLIHENVNISIISAPILVQFDQLFPLAKSAQYNKIYLNHSNEI